MTRFGDQLLATCRLALSAALPPRPQVARHWETPDALHWLAVLPASDGFHVAYSLGRLRGVAEVPGAPHTSGLFRLSGAVFRGVDEAALLAELRRQVPEVADGPTRAFLLRVVGQLAAAEVAVALEAQPLTLPLPPAPGFACHVPARGDALYEAAATPRRPGHASERVEAALDAMEPSLTARVRALFAAPHEVLVDAVRHLDAPEGRPFE